MAVTKNQTRRGNSRKGVPEKKASIKGHEVLKSNRFKPEKKLSVVKRERIKYLEELRTYFRSVYNELKKVHWPTRREVLIYSSVVVIAVVIIGIFIWIFDSILSWLVQSVVK